MKKGRSPNYPRITFEDALIKAKKIYADNHNYSAGKEIIAKSLGYSSINGGSLTMFGAIRAYGLLEITNDGLKVSDSAVNLIMLPEGNHQWLDEVMEAIFKPDIFNELREKYGDTLPNDNLIKHFLVTNKNYLSKAADEVIRVYRANLVFANDLQEKYNKDMKPSASQSDFIPPPRPVLTPQNYRYGNPQVENFFPEPNEKDFDSGQELRFRISADSEARIIFKGEVTQKAIKKLIELLKISLDTFPENGAVLPEPPITIQPNLLEEGLFEYKEVSEEEEEEEE